MCNRDSNVDAWDVNYPIESSMADVVVGLIVQDLTRSLAIEGDDVNDASNDRKETPRYDNRRRR